MSLLKEFKELVPNLLEMYLTLSISQSHSIKTINRDEIDYIFDDSVHFIKEGSKLGISYKILQDLYFMQLKMIHYFLDRYISIYQKIRSNSEFILVVFVSSSHFIARHELHRLRLFIWYICPPQHKFLQLHSTK